MEQISAAPQGVTINLSIIAALTPHGVVGKDGRLPWNLPSDLARFKRLTTGHPVIMGRKTWESLPEMAHPLPNRTNIVMTRSAGYEAEGATVVNSFDCACLAAAGAKGADEIFVIGGSELFKTAIHFASKAYLTMVNSSARGTAWWFPLVWRSQAWERVDSSPWEHHPGDDHPTMFTEYRRLNK